MTNHILRTTIGISFVTHIVAFATFNLSFGKRILNNNPANVYFFGRILHTSELITIPQSQGPASRRKAFLKNPDTSIIENARKDYLRKDFYLKPPITLLLAETKLPYIAEAPYYVSPVAKKKSAIMFHPQLPYNLLVYFRDRQTVNIELAYSIISDDKTSYVAIKRKISSGNLEADLLSMRYINHYLSVQQRMFPVNKWQTVKIELSAQNKR